MRTMGIRIDQAVNNIENTLSDISAYPVVGIVSGVIKVSLGVIQAIVGLACAILFLAPYVGDVSAAKHAWTHFQHGLGNILAGTLEGIPGLGTAIYALRLVNPASDHMNRIDARSGHEHKWMPYSSLEDQDWQPAGENQDRANNAKAWRSQREWMSFQEGRTWVDLHQEDFANPPPPENV